MDHNQTKHVVASCGCRTLIPVFIGAFYRFHPSAVTDTTRDSAALWLVCGWSARLTYSYFRRYCAALKHHLYVFHAFLHLCTVSRGTV